MRLSQWQIPLSTVQLLSCVWLFVTPWTAARQASLVHLQLLEPAQTHVHWVGDAIQTSHPLLFLCLQFFPASGSLPMSWLWLFASDGYSIQMASASASVLPMNIQGWFPLGLTTLISLLSKGPLKSLLQNHSLKASILQHSAFFMVQLSHLYMTTGKTIALIIWTFDGKVIVSAF